MRQWLLVLITGFSLLFSVGCFAGDEGVSPAEREPADEEPVSEVAISVLAVREDAENLAEKIRSSGFKTLVRAYETDDGRTVYGVFVIVHEESPKEEGRTDTGLPPGLMKPQGRPATWKDLLPGRAGYVHAGLGLSGVYTDNAFNTKADKKSDFSMILSPEIWFALPGLNQRPKGLDPISTRSPGGLLLGREGEEGTRRYRAFLHYQADIPQHSETSPSGNTVIHNVNGGIAYRFPFGLTLSLNNEFSRSYERLDSVLSGGEVDRFRGNLLYLSASLDTGSRLRLRVDYSNFLLRYDADRNDRLNRDDNFFSAYVFYRLWPKTALFAQYTFTDIKYADNRATNSKEHGLLGGFGWDVTAKTRGTVKAGWGKKDFADFSTSNFIYEGKVDHRFSPKASVSVTAFGQTSETNIPAAFYTMDRGVIANFQHMVSSKVTGWASVSYTNQKYGQELTFDGKTEKRRDNYYEASAGIDYWFKKGLKAGISYAFATRKSNISAFDYQSNTVMFNIKGAI